MPPMYGHPNYDFVESHKYDDDSNDDRYEDGQSTSVTEMAFWYMIALVAMLLLWLFLFFCLRIIALRQKTRSPQRRPAYGGSRARPSLDPQEPTIYVSPSNLPPPPKYECLAPPSYEEVVGIHYPNYQVQPISQPINAALAEGSSSTPANSSANIDSNAHNVDNSETIAPAPVSVTVTSETRRTSVTVAR